MACRSDSHLDNSPSSGALIGLVSIGTVGFVVGRTYILHAHDASAYHGAARGDLELWAVLVGAFTGYAAAADIVSVVWTHRLLGLFVTKVGPLTKGRWVAVIALTPLPVSFLTFFSRGSGALSASYEHQVFVVTVFGIITAVLGLRGLLVIRSLALDDSQWPASEPAECRIGMVTRLRTELRRFLAMLGLLLTITVVATAQRRASLLALTPGTIFPPQYVVLYGLAFAGLLALYHGAASIAIDGRSERIVARYAPLPSPEDADFDAGLKKRTSLQGLLGLGTGWQQSFQNGVIVLAPLLTALIGSALPTK